MADTYTSITNAPEITGTGLSPIYPGGWIIGTSLNWQSNLSKRVTLDGNMQIPDIIKGQAVVQVQLPPDGGGVNLEAVPETTSVDLCINGDTWPNTYYTGGQVGVIDLGEGMKSLTIAMIFTIFGDCAEAASA